MAAGLPISLLASVGAIVLIRFLHSVTQFILLHFWTPSRPLQPYKRAGSDTYALVTGASAGIGFGIARALVHQGFGVILLGHLPDELESAAKTLTAIPVRPDVPAPRLRTLVVNARTATPAQITAAVESISDLNVSILVNNVGGIPIADPPLRPLSTLSVAEVDAHIDLNARFMARLTNLVLPLLSSSSASRGQERSLILNVSSAGRIGLPWLVMYSATKAFNYAFSAALSRELQDDPATAHVDCLAVVPGEVQSQANVMASPGNAPTSEEFGRAVVATVDGAVSRGWREVRPYWGHDITIGLMDSVMPDRVTTHFAKEELRVKKDKWDVIIAKRR